MISQGSGGGYGDVLERDPEAVMADVEAGYLSGETAREIYFVVYDPDTLAVDAAATQAARDAERQARLRRGRPYGEFVKRVGDRGAARPPALLRLVGRRQQRHPRHRLGHAGPVRVAGADGPAAADLPARSNVLALAAQQARIAQLEARPQERKISEPPAGQPGRAAVRAGARDLVRRRGLRPGQAAAAAASVGFPGRARLVRRQDLQGMFRSDAILVDRAEVFAQRAAADPQLRAAMAARSRPGYGCERCSVTSRPAAPQWKRSGSWPPPRPFPLVLTVHARPVARRGRRAGRIRSGTANRPGGDRRDLRRRHPADVRQTPGWTAAPRRGQVPKAD